MAENVIEKFLTPQELLLIGSSSKAIEVEGADLNWHKPEAVSEGTIRDISVSRQRSGWYEGGMLGFMLGVPNVGIKLSDLDPKTGETLSDPVIGVRDESTDEYVERLDLTMLIYTKLKEAGMDPHLREVTSETELESKRGGIEK